MTTSFRSLRGTAVPKSLYAAINRQVGRCLHHYDMLSPGDRVAVGLSGGKDSTALLWILDERRRRLGMDLDLVAIHVDPGFSGEPAEAVAGFGKKLGIPVHVEKTDHGPLAHSEQNRENPCFLCSRLRRKRLFELTKELGCAKLALGHHKDDIIETVFLNMFYSGEICTMVPRQEFFGGEITVIRPLGFADEAKIERLARLLKIPRVSAGCPSESKSKRSEVKQMLADLYKTNPKIRGNIFRSLSRVRMDYMLSDDALEK